MKKFFVVMLVFGFVTGMVFAQAPAKKTTVSLNAGALFQPWTEVNIYQATGDVRVGFRLTRWLELSPQFMIGAGSGYSTYYLSVLANAVTKHFFAGAGLIMPIQRGTSDTIGPEANVGLILGHVQLTVYAAAASMEPGLDETNAILGATLGYRF